MAFNFMAAVTICPREGLLNGSFSMTGGSDSKDLPAIWETWVQSLGHEDSLEKGMATHSSIPVWRIPWTEETSRFQCSPWGHKESDMTERQTHTYLTMALIINIFTGCSSASNFVYLKRL